MPLPGGECRRSRTFSGDPPSTSRSHDSILDSIQWPRNSIIDLDQHSPNWRLLQHRKASLTWTAPSVKQGTLQKTPTTVPRGLCCGFAQAISFPVKLGSLHRNRAWEASSASSITGVELGAVIRPNGIVFKAHASQSPPKLHVWWWQIWLADLVA